MSILPFSKKSINIALWIIFNVLTVSTDVDDTSECWVYSSNWTKNENTVFTKNR